MDDRDEPALEALADADADEQGLDNPASDQVDFGRDDDPTAGGSDIGGRAGEPDDDPEPPR
jgi:hypothetical protein